MPDLRRRLQQGATSLLWWRHELSRLVSSHARGTVEFKRRHETLQQVRRSRVAAYNLLRGLDHALQLAGSSLAKYSPGSGSRRLRGGEKRRRQPVPATEGVPVGAFRFVVENDEDKKKRYEVPKYREGLNRPVLALYMDSGSDNYAALAFAIDHLGLRIVPVWDIWHAWHNAWLNALKQAGQWERVQEQLSVLNLHHGPWRSCAFWKTIQEAVEQAGPEQLLGSELWLCLGEKICVEKGYSQDQATDPDVQAKVLKQLVLSRCFLNKGGRVALRSWFSQLQRLDEFLPDFHSELLALCLVGIHMGFWRKASECPVFGALTQVRSVPGLGAECAEDSSAQQRSQCANAIHMAANILGDERTYSRWKGMLEVGRPLWTAFSAAEKLMKDPEGVKNYYVQMAKGASTAILRRIFNVLRFYNKWVGLGLQEASGEEVLLTEWKGALPAPYPQKQMEHVVGEQQWSQDMMHLALRLVAHMAVNTAQYSDSFPGLLSLLLANDAETQQMGLRAVVSASKVLLAAEDIALEDRAVRLVLDCVPWVNNTSIRELLLGTAENMWVSVPEEHLEVVRCLFLGFGHTSPVENGFKVVEEMSKKCGGQALSRIKRWFAMASGGVYKRYERAETEVCEEHKAGAPLRKFPTACFDALAGSPSLDNKVLGSITGKATWSTFSAQTMLAGIAAWKALEYAHDEKKWVVVRKTWVCRLFMEDSIVYEEGPGRYYAVLKAYSHALLLWPMVHLQYCNYDFFVPQGQAGRAAWRVVTAFEGWQVVPVRACPPLLHENKLQYEGKSVGIAFIRFGRNLSVLQYAASVGFQGVTASDLVRVMALLGVPKADRPKLQIDIIVLLVQQLCPNYATADVVAALKTKVGIGGRAELGQGWLTAEENIDHAAGVVDDSDLAMMRKHVKETSGPRKLQQADVLEYCKAKKWLGARDLSLLEVLQSDPQAVRAKAAKQEKGKDKKLRIIKNWTPAELKKLIPQRKGCVIMNYGLLKKCIVYYPGVLPKSRSRTWGGAYSQRQVWAHCLKWAWAHHTALTGTPCPWDLETGVGHEG